MDAGIFNHFTRKTLVDLPLRLCKVGSSQEAGMTSTNLSQICACLASQGDPRSMRARLIQGRAYHTCRLIQYGRMHYGGTTRSLDDYRSRWEGRVDEGAASVRAVQRAGARRFLQGVPRTMTRRSDLRFYSHLSVRETAIRMG